MDTPPSDSDLARLVRAAAKAAGYSPAAFLELAQECLRNHRYSVMPHFAPFPHVEEEFTLGKEHLAGWPEWTSALLDTGFRLERLRCPDGGVVTRLLDRRALVLAARVE